VRDLLRAQCEAILAGVECVFAGPSSLLMVDGATPPEVELARRFGALVHAELVPSSTHILVPPALLAEGTLQCERTGWLLRQMEAHRLRGRVQLVDARWLLDCVSRWQRLPESDYTLPLDCLANPFHHITLSSHLPTTNPYVAAPAAAGSAGDPARSHE